ncbi:hypothetical protein B0I08_102181 [Glaciihabitans tibetensis]|uniref:Uncharacterized protein n=2 Tax=Glaciihabitans tibetensis TaxID=1266600 RepID=A0A2T0VH07_9MICO|nr:hypothetical protein B0I08_102181 [Glaciihabitans tibetensis]
MIWRIFLAILAFGVIAQQALVTWGSLDPSPSFQGWALFIGGLLVLIESIAALFTSANAAAEQVRLKSAEKVVLASLKTISDSTGIDLLCLGGSVFLAKKTGLRQREFLHRELRYRLSDVPQPSDVEWVKGKGVVGSAWKDKHTVHKDLSAIADRYGASELNEASFLRLRADTRGGFTREEFHSIIGKYAEVLAVLIWNSAQTSVIGVYAIDVPMTAVHEKSGTLLNEHPIHEIASSCASLLGDVLQKK